MQFREFDFNPVIIIGAGRSGSTLLSNVLGAHSDFYMPAETSFLLPKLYKVLWQDPEYLRKTKIYSYVHRLMHSDILVAEFVEKVMKSEHNYEKLYLQYEKIEQERMLDVVKDSFFRAIKPEAFLEKRWGIKEIWNGISHHNYDWEIYNKCFPDARWVHNIRNPFEFARSNAAWASQRFSLEFLKEQLKNWVEITKKAQEQASRIYFEIRYEDLVLEPEKNIESIFKFIELDMQKECLRATRYKYHKSPEKEIWPNADSNDFDKINDLKSLMAQYGYSSPYDN